MHELCPSTARPPLPPPPCSATLLQVNEETPSPLPPPPSFFLVPQIELHLTFLFHKFRVLAALDFSFNAHGVNLRLCEVRRPAIYSFPGHLTLCEGEHFVGRRNFDFRNNLRLQRSLQAFRGVSKGTKTLAVPQKIRLDLHVGPLNLKVPILDTAVLTILKVNCIYILSG